MSSYRLKSTARGYFKRSASLALRGAGRDRAAEFAIPDFASARASPLTDHQATTFHDDDGMIRTARKAALWDVVDVGGMILSGRLRSGIVAESPDASADREPLSRDGRGGAARRRRGGGEEAR